MLNNNELISIIIPIYKVESFLCECIESVICQTYSNIEIILVDDGSPDCCPQICDEYEEKDSRISVIHKSNGGLSDARNAGLSRAKGEYVYFLDSDDNIEADAIEMLVNVAVHYTADVVFFDANVFNEIDSSNYKNDFYIRKGLYSNPLKGVKMLGQLIRYNEYRSAVPLLFIRRNVLTENNLSFRKDIVYEDELFTFNLLLRSSLVVHLSEPLYNRRVRGNSITSSKSKSHNLRSILVVASEIFNTYLAIEATDDIKYVVHAYVSRIIQSVNNVYYSLPAKERAPFNKEIKEFKEKLRNENYLGNHDVQIFCDKMRISQAKKRIKRLMPNLCKSLIRNIYGSLKRYDTSEKIIAHLKTTRMSARLILIGTPVHGNLGDHAIAEAEKELLNKFFPDREYVDIVMPTYCSYSKKIKNYINKNDIIMISGGGWLGTLWKHNEDVVREIVNSYPNNRIVILPQTVYFDNSEEGRKEVATSREIYSKHSRLLFCLRDKASYEFVVKNKFTQKTENTLYMPDMVLYLKPEVMNTDREGVLLCFRMDREKNMSCGQRRRIREWLWEKGETTTYTTTVYLDNVPMENRQDAVLEKLEEYSKAKLIITDRLHSMLFAAITSTPCIAFDNLTGKVKGVYEWINNMNYIKVVNNEEEAIIYIDKMLNINCDLFDNSAIMESFSILVLKIRNL